MYLIKIPTSSLYRLFFDENCYNLTDMDRKFRLIQKIKSNLGNFEFDSIKLPKKAKKH